VEDDVADVVGPVLIGAGTEVRLELEYELKQANLLTPLVDLLFIRRALRDSLRRTLARFGYERRAEMDLG
jgi:hypothetical protein